MKPIYYDLTKLNEFFGIAPGEPIEILSPEQLEEQGIIKQLTDEWQLTGPLHPSYVHGMSQNPEDRRKLYWENRDEKLRLKRQYRLENKDKIKTQKKERYEKKRQEIRYNARKKYWENKNIHPCVCLFTGMVY